MGRECKYNEITVEKLFNVVHRYTEPIKIHVVGGIEGCQDKVKDFYITENFAKSQEEIDRVLKYYADVPVWNLHIAFDGMRCKSGEVSCHGLMASIVANCHYKDVREGYLREKEDIRKAKRKEYRERKKVKENKNANRKAEGKIGGVVERSHIWSERTYFGRPFEPRNYREGCGISYG